MSGERFTLDTNILVYAFDVRAGARHEFAVQMIEAAAERDCPLALQVVGEFYAVASAKLKLGPKDAAVHAAQFATSFESFGYSVHAVRAALDEVSKGRFSFWDAVLLASAAEAGCTTIFSEDMGDGARFGSITVANPFAHDGFAPRAKATLGL